MCSVLDRWSFFFFFDRLIDHYLGKEGVRAIAEFRALNPGVWDAAHVNRVEVAMKESIGAAGRTGFYDRYGVVRDVMQNHLMEMLALLATGP